MELLRMKGVNITLIILLSLSSILFADKSFTLDQSLSTSMAYYFPDHGGYNLEGDFAPIDYSVIEGDEGERNLGSSIGGFELIEEYKFSLTKGVLQGESFLTKDNKFKITGKAKLSPVTTGLDIDLLLTPVAFLDFYIGTGFDTGWFALNVVGLGLNNEGTTPNEAPFQGALSQTWVGGTFKFDLAAVLPGDPTWKHIVLLSNHKYTYKHFSEAENSDPWVFQGADSFNHLEYKSTTLLGYQMPLILETAGLLIETTHKIHADDNFNTDFVKVRFGGIFNLKFNEQHSLAILPQFTTRERYTDSSVKEEHFTNREVDSTSPIYYDFERVALSYTYKF